MKSIIRYYVFLSAGIVLLSTLLSTEGLAHHIRGLPHYGYSENYPQIPTYEEMRIVEPWQIIFSYVRIFETKNCDLAVYIKNSNTGRPFKGVVNFRVFEEYENPQDVHDFNAEVDPTNTFRVGWTYEEDGLYIVRITFHDAKKTHVEDFRMQMGEVGLNPLLFIFPGAAIGILIILNVFARTKGRTRRKP